MENEFVTYEQALALKELGFDEPCFYQYVRDFDNDGELIPIVSDSNYPILRNNTQVSNCSGGDCFAAPLYQQSFKFFREKYNHSYLQSFPNKEWNFVIEDISEKGYKRQDGSNRAMPRTIFNSDLYNSYEEAEKACLDKLIKIVKDGTRN